MTRRPTPTKTTVTIAAGVLAAIVAVAGLSVAAAFREWLFLPIVVAAGVVIALLARWHRRGEELAASMRRHPSGKALGRAAVPPGRVPPATDHRRAGGSR